MMLWYVRHRHYYSWVLAMLISQQGKLLHTFPRTIFSVKNFTVGGYSCMPDKIPIDRRISYPLASNLYKVCALKLPKCNSDVRTFKCNFLGACCHHPARDSQG